MAGRSLRAALMVGIWLLAETALAGPAPTPTPIENRCESVILSGNTEPRDIPEGNAEVCVDVDAPDECCWTTTVDGYAERISPEVQCGDQAACMHVFNCDCSGCRFDFGMEIAGQRVSGRCVNVTPTATLEATPTPTPTLELCDTVSLPGEVGLIIVGEGNVERCIAVDAPGECCWTAVVDGVGPTSPQVQCGDQLFCFYVGSCDCSGCRTPFTIQIADTRVEGLCANETATMTMTPTDVPEATPTVTPDAPLATATAERTATDTPRPEPSETPVPSPTWTASPEPSCTGDCDRNGAVTVEEVVTLVNIALGTHTLEACPASGNLEITVAEVVTAVHHALDGCAI